MSDKAEFLEEDRSNCYLVRLRLLLSAVVSIPKTIWFNLRYFPFREAIGFPVLIAFNVKVSEMHRGQIVFDGNRRRFMVKIGFGGSDSISEHKSSICIERNGKLVFGGSASFSKGINLRSSGKIYIGNNFYANKNCTIWCSKEITFGKDVLIGWNTMFRDSDGHMVLVDNVPRPITGSISIGNHSWICSECHVLKHSKLGSDCVLGYGSLLMKSIDEDNILAVGWPANIKKRNVNWIRGK